VTPQAGRADPVEQELTDFLTDVVACHVIG
jgi:hypothetical protein